MSENIYPNGMLNQPVETKNTSSSTPTMSEETSTIIKTNVAGFTGSRGPAGFTGSRGATGPLGPTGLTGAPGASGARGASGPVGPQGPAGRTGSLGYTGSRGLDGIRGVQGFVGSRGLPGTQGMAGFIGSRGSQGLPGFTGSRGTDGIRGGTGYTGSRGLPGDIGTRGYTGSASTLPGFTGSAGTVGFTGSRGLPGEAAAIGYTGSAGTVGFTGSAGTPGQFAALGYTGSAGTVGFTGSAGTVGFTGSRGLSGYTGSAGQGSTGYTGSAGSVGPAGTVNWANVKNHILPGGTVDSDQFDIGAQDKYWRRIYASEVYVGPNRLKDITTGQIIPLGGSGGSSTLAGLSDVQLTNSALGQVLTYNGTKWINAAPAGGGSSTGLASRSSVSFAGGNNDVVGFKSYALLSITTSSAAWVRIYINSSSRTADASRSAATDPLPSAGLVAEVITNGSETVYFSPAVIGYNADSTIGNTIYIRSTNISGTSNVGGSLTILRLEA